MGKLARTLMQRLIKTAFRRGIVEGNRAWLALGIAAWLVRVSLRPKKPRIRKEVLKPGESVVVRNVPARERRRRKAKSRA